MKGVGAGTDPVADKRSALDRQLRSCWLRCDKCGARRLVNEECWAAVATEAYQKDWRDDLVDKGHLRDPCGAARWRGWLDGARARYEHWSGSTRCGVSVDRADMVACDADIDADARGDEAAAR